MIYETLNHDIFKHGASIVCLVSSLEANQMLKRDLLPKKRSRSRVARLLALIGDMPGRSLLSSVHNMSRFCFRWAHAEELSGLQQVNECSSPTSAGMHEVAKPITERADARPLAAMTEFTPTCQKAQQSLCPSSSSMVSVNSGLFGPSLCVQAFDPFRLSTR